MLGAVEDAGNEIMIVTIEAVEDAGAAIMIVISHHHQQPLL